MLPFVSGSESEFVALCGVLVRQCSDLFAAARELWRHAPDLSAPTLDSGITGAAKLPARGVEDIRCCRVMPSHLGVTLLR